MLLVYTQQVTPRISYIFKHICTQILGIEVGYTSVIEELIAHAGPKLSYGRQPMGNELFIQSHGLLNQQGVESLEITVRPWDDTFGFFAVGEKSALPFDIFSAAFFLLSRYEEYLPHVKDELGRFPASESIAWQGGFLRQPIVDIWAMKFREVLAKSFPKMSFSERTPVVHTILESQVPFRYKHRGVFRSIIGYARDLGKFRFRSLFKRSRVLLTLRKDPYNTLEWAVEKSRDSANLLSVFFMLGEAYSFENNFNTQRNLFKLLIKYVSDYRPVGLIFSFAALTDYEQMKGEKKRMEEVTHRTVINSMSALYRVNLPETYRNLVELEVETDYTMVYEDEVGFRAGTCTPFRFYDLDYEIKTPLVIHPLAGTSKGLSGKKRAEVVTCIDNLKQSVADVQGVFSFVISNRDLVEGKSKELWRYLFTEKLL